MNDDLERKILDLSDRIDASRGSEILMLLKILDISYYVFETNRNELRSHLSKFRDLTEVTSVWSPNVDQFRLEATRLLYNFVSSAKSLVDHTRPTARRVLPDEAHAEYERRVKQQFKDSPLANFVEDLREFALHYRVPLVAASAVSTRDEQSNTWMTRGYLRLHTADLVKWDRWGPRSREYIDAAKDGPDIESVIETYSGEVFDIQNWIRQTAVVSNSDVFDELRSLVDEQERLRSLRDSKSGTAG
jgi:hypothetical protein